MLTHWNDECKGNCIQFNFRASLTVVIFTLGHLPPFCDDVVFNLRAYATKFIHLHSLFFYTMHRLPYSDLVIIVPTKHCRWWRAHTRHPSFLSYLPPTLSTEWGRTWVTSEEGCRNSSLSKWPGWLFLTDHGLQRKLVTTEANSGSERCLSVELWLLCARVVLSTELRPHAEKNIPFTWRFCAPWGPHNAHQ